MKHIFFELGRRMMALAEGGFSDDFSGPSDSLLTADPFLSSDSLSSAARAAAANVARAMLTPQALEDWLALYPWVPVAEPRNVLIIMAGNIPFVGAHDLICVLAAGHRAIVKPSSRDSASAAWMVRQLLDIEPTTPVTLLPPTPAQCMWETPQLSPEPNAVIAMGGDEAVKSISLIYSGLPMLLRGSRSSLAVLSGGETDDRLEGLADDILLHSGLGCRNVSLIFVPRGYDFAPLQSILARRTLTLERRHRNNFRQSRALLSLALTPHIDCGSVLLTESAGPISDSISGTLADFSAQPSVVNYAFYDILGDVSDWIQSKSAQVRTQEIQPDSSLIHDPIQCIASDFFSHPRAVPLGRTQHPGLGDYPDGADTMNFLATI